MEDVVRNNFLMMDFLLLGLDDDELEVDVREEEDVVDVILWSRNDEEEVVLSFSRIHM